MKESYSIRPPVPSGDAISDYGGGLGNSRAGGAKNSLVKTGHHWNINLGTYNVKTPCNNKSTLELEHELSKVKWDVIGISETRRKGESKIQLKSGNVIYWKEHDDRSELGVGFHINKEILSNIINFKAINERIITITIQLTRKYKIQIIQVYPPTSHDDKEIEDFYESLDSTIKEEESNATITMEDSNAKVGTSNNNTGKCTGKFGNGTRNKRGERLIEFETYKKMRPENTFKKKSAKRWTWRSPNDTTKNEIDSLLTDAIGKAKDVSVLNRVNIGSDHRFLRCTLRIDNKNERTRMTRKPDKVCTKNRNMNMEAFQIKLANRFKQLHSDPEYN